MSLLAETPFFANFPSAVLEALESASTRRKFRKQTHLIIAADDGLTAYVMLSGSAYAFIDDAEGNEFVVGSFGEGDLFGELGLLDDKARSANVVTRTDCECLVIPRAAFQHCLDTDHEAALAAIRSLVHRIRDMTDDVSCLALMDVYGRLARLLRNSVVVQADGVEKTDKLTHRDLAMRIGSSREMVSRILKDLRIGGYIENDPDGIRLLKPLPDRW